jgi:uncharacterized membrane protein
MKINLKSVILSGLIAGLSIIISGMALVPIVGNEMDAILFARGLPPLSLNAMIYFLFMSLILGVFVVWVYAAFIPRLGVGLKTALITALIVWFLAYFWSNMSMLAYGFMPWKITVIGTAWGMVELVLASIIGSKLYKDK